jgi:DNA mismatch repair protein MutH
MRLEEALEPLSALCNKPMDTIIEGLPGDLRINKGRVGQLLELYLGLTLGNDHTDFEDGELKTNKVRPNGKPRETIFLTQISKDIDNLISTPPVPFEHSQVYTKIKKVVVVPVVKDGPERDWSFGHIYLVDLENEIELRTQLQEDYHSITNQLVDHIATDPKGFIHTSSGKYLQIRSKDSKPYHPIFSEMLGQYISDKNHAFYFKWDFMLHLRDQGPRYRICNH